MDLSFETRLKFESVNLQARDNNGHKLKKRTELDTKSKIGQK